MMTGTELECTMGNSINDRVKISLADHDDLLYGHHIVKFRHNPMGHDDLRNHIYRHHQIDSYSTMVAGTPTALAQVFKILQELESTVAQQGENIWKDASWDLHNQKFSFVYSESNVALTLHTYCPGRGFVVSPTMSQESHEALFEHVHPPLRPPCGNQGLGWLIFFVCHSLGAKRIVSIDRVENDITNTALSCVPLPGDWNRHYNCARMEEEDPLLLLCECCNVKRWLHEDVNQCHWCDFVVVGPCCVSSGDLGSHLDPYGVQNITCDNCKHYQNDYDDLWRDDGCEPLKHETRACFRHRAKRERRHRFSRAANFVQMHDEVWQPMTGEMTVSTFNQWASSSTTLEQATPVPSLFICEFCYTPAVVPYPWCGICQASPSWHHFGCCLEQWPLYNNEGAIYALLSPQCPGNPEG